MKKDSKFLRHEPCPSCGSSDALARYSNGSGHCFAAGCGHHEHSTDFAEFRNKIAQESDNAWGHMNNEKLNRANCDDVGVIAAIPDRKISQDTCRKFGVTVQYDAVGTINNHFYPYKDIDSGEVKGHKKKVLKIKLFLI